jgi:hypothetical protein
MIAKDAAARDRAPWLPVAALMSAPWEPLAAVEASEQRPLADAGLARHGVHRDPLHAQLVDETGGGGQDRLPVARGVSPLGRRRVRHREADGHGVRVVAGATPPSRISAPSRE